LDPGSEDIGKTHNYMAILPPIYENSEMAGIEDEIRALEEEIQRTPYNKATSKHIGRGKAKIGRVKDEAVQRAMKSAGGGEGFTVKSLAMRPLSLSGSLPPVRVRSSIRSPERRAKLLRMPSPRSP